MPGTRRPFDHVDPFTQVLDAIWSALEAHKPFTDRVKVGNRIRTDSQNWIREQTQDADTPEVRIIQTGGEPHTGGSSTKWHMRENYSIEISTATARHSLINRVRWETYRAIAKAETTLGLDFIHRVTMQTQQVGLDIGDNGKSGWASVLIIAVDMHFDPMLDLERQ